MYEVLCMTKIKIALTGKPGVGKDSFVSIISEYYDLGEIKLASVFYKAQKYIYDLCGQQKDYFIQDGILLNFLGQHMRSINPYVVREHFFLELQKLQENKIIIASDVRPWDFPFIKNNNFILVKITSSEKNCLIRRIARGDKTLSDSNHSTELSSNSIKEDYYIENNSSYDDYKKSVLQLVDSLYMNSKNDSI